MVPPRAPIRFHEAGMMISRPLWPRPRLRVPGFDALPLPLASCPVAPSAPGPIAAARPKWGFDFDPFEIEWAGPDGAKGTAHVHDATRAGVDDNEIELVPEPEGPATSKVAAAGAKVLVAPLLAVLVALKAEFIERTGAS